MLKVIGLLFLLSLSNSFECNRKGYNDYLARYSFKSEDYDQNRLAKFIVNCNNLNSMKKTCSFANFTSLMDWKDEELEELSQLGVQYSGHPLVYTEVDPITQEEMSVEKKSREFSLKAYNNPEKKCSTSWATAAIRAAEAALNYEVELSEEQLFTCLPKDLGFADGCEGIHPKKLMDYLLEDGLVEKGVFDGCDKLDGLKRYHFAPTIPDTLTASGLMNLLAKENKPAFVMMAVDLKKLVFVKDMTNIEDVVKCGGYQPSLYGVLTGYKYSENGGSAWWEVVTNVIPGEEIVMKLPVSSNMYNANYAGIAAYAFTLSEEVEPTTEPTTEPPTVEPTTVPPTVEPSTVPPTVKPTTVPPTVKPTTVPPTVKPTTVPPTEPPTTVVTTIPPTPEVTTEPPTTVVTTEPPTPEVTTEPPTTDFFMCEDVTISSEDDCGLLFNVTNIRSLTVNEGLCNGMHDDLVIADSPCLKEIVFGLRSLQNLTSLTIANNTELIKIETGDMEGSASMLLRNTNGSLFFVNSVKIESMMIDEWLI